MSTSDQIPELTAEQQQALDAQGGIVQGRSFMLTRTDVVLSDFGDSTDKLARTLQPAIDQVERGELHP